MAGSGRACGTDDSDEVKEVDAMAGSGGVGVGAGLGVDVCVWSVEGEEEGTW